MNTVDRTAPSNRVTDLPLKEPAGFVLSWSGSDFDAGIRDFTVYVSDNNGPYTEFQLNTTLADPT